MGSCASVYSRSECSAVKVPTAAAETVTDKYEILASPIKQFKLPNSTKSDIKDISVISHHYKNPSGSKEEAFFDSRAWLDSDCEDFFSVNGDFTPSCGNTPLHNCTAETPPASKVGADDEPSSFKRPPLQAKRRKKLADLFRESLGDDPSFGLLNHEDNRKADELCISGTGSVCSSERTAGAGGDELADENSIGFGSKLCCLPPVVSRHSSSKRKEELIEAC